MMSINYIGAQTVVEGEPRFTALTDEAGPENESIVKNQELSEMFQKPYILPEPELKQNNVRPRKLERCVGLPNITVYPNPAKNYLIIECITEFLATTKLLQLVNSIGQPVLEQGLDRFGRYSIIDLIKLPNGTYTGRVLVDGKVSGAFKVLINK
ncbi:MAG: T9SS type A sorting domain-containing protein [Bacteroidales bacterium]|nr:T9SS type A sorting domain-containing protein [Bacteroidales bacterium]